MTEENKEIQQEAKAPEVDMAQVTEMLESLKEANTLLKEDNKNILAKNGELIGEKRKEQAKVADAAEAKLRSKGDVDSLKTLLNSSNEKNKEWETKFDTLSTQISKDRIHTEAMKIATDVSDGKKANVLCKILEDRLVVLDKADQLDQANIDAVKADIIASGDYDFLIRGIQSNGGGATGSSSSAPTVKEMKESDYLKLDPHAQRKFIVTDKGKVIDG